MARVPTILWRRLDRPGHDACRLMDDGDHRMLTGTAVWQDGRTPAVIAYEISINSADWSTRSARLRGWAGGRDISLSIQHDGAGNWRMNGEPVPEVTGQRDIDLGFTPASNLMPLRRLMAARSDHASMAAAWLDPADWALKLLPQDYRRDGDGGWRYASPTHDFEARLSVDADGFVTDYPGLWVKEG